MFGIQRPQLKVLEVCFRSHIFNQRMPIACLLPDHIAFYVNSVELVFFKKWAPCSSPICFQMFYSVFVSHQNSSVTSHMFTYQRLVCFPMKRPWLASSSSVHYNCSCLPFPNQGEKDTPQVLSSLTYFSFSSE